MFFRKYVFGNAALYFSETKIADLTGVGLTVLPLSREFDREKYPPDPLVQVAFTEDRSLHDYSRGVSVKNRESAILKVEEQTATNKGVTTRLTDGKGNFYTHELEYDEKTGVFSAYVCYENKTGKPRTLEYLASACISVVPARGEEELILHRMTSAWSRECRLKSECFCEPGLERSWASYGLKSEKWGCIGSMSNRGYYPFAAIEDGDGTVWGVSLEAPYSWQMDLSIERGISLSAGLADYEAGHWRKRIESGERFATHKAYFTVKERGGVGAVSNAFVHAADARLHVPESEESMPVLFNEYCASWGTPSEERIGKMLTALEGFPVGIFVIDCGWFKPKNRDWNLAGGDWRENAELFPHGIKATVEKIKAHGMKAGVWFEFEVAARESELYKNEALLLKRDENTITCKNRRFLDLRKREAKQYIEERMLAFLKENGFEYLKIDYNDCFGIGCDGAESLGEGGRQVAEESLVWLDRLRDEGIVVENCASGGSRIEPLRMSKVSMCSFSDAHECAEIPLVAANVSRVVPARQSQIWAVLREGESDERTIYSLCAAFMGRVCLSGDIETISENKKNLIRAGLDFYSEIMDIVRYGDIQEIDCTVKSYRNPEGRQVYRKAYAGRELVITHFLNCGEAVEIPLQGYRLERAYTDLKYEEQSGILRVYGKPYHAGAFLLKKENE